MAESTKDLHPKKVIRRFDVFAEYTRQDRVTKGDPDDVAAGYGIWLAKVVAARKFNPKSTEKSSASGHKPSPDGEKFRSLDGEAQTDCTFDIDIVKRMGTEFYHDVFVPAIASARAEGTTPPREVVDTGGQHRWPTKVILTSRS